MSEEIGRAYLDSVIKRFENLKALGEAAFNQLNDAEFGHAPAPECNSVTVTVKHLRGNMISRFTEFLTSDGEKPWRGRDDEFVVKGTETRADVMAWWEEGWERVFDSIDALSPEDLTRTVRIRGNELSAVDAINRQLQHYAYHVGQIVLLAKLHRGGDWNTLSIPRGKSEEYFAGNRD